ncbi:Rne/Rng family ribonuclease [Aciditerrimonas ferrireducens]|uniref:Rne/Rng family ribonuclease n=1 Tax=Aciditerrimonas ferrireducens TaxID=667306 RepID=UPI0020058F8B|nr:Rne/Rng family ribonuclease [Aciditerrimonas ferrireducens]MCK4177474.1 Rne/Rng family ribonuclease [Aciditerrimonas ferrireducens]
MSDDPAGTPVAGAADDSPPVPGPAPAAPSGSPARPVPGPAEGPTNGQAAPAKPRIGDTRPAPPVLAKPRIGDTRPAPPVQGPPSGGASRSRRRRRGSGGQGGSGGVAGGRGPSAAPSVSAPPAPSAGRAGRGTEGPAGTTEGASNPPSRPRGERRRERRSRAVGRYMMCVHVRPEATQIAVLEGRTLVEHLVSRAADDVHQIDGNIYQGRVQNVLPGMEAAFVDIGTPKNAVLYRGDVRYDPEDVEGEPGAQPRIEDVLEPGQLIVCQVTKNPIGAKGARLTQEVSLPGRFAVMVPNSRTFGISKRLDDAERRRLRRILDEVRPEGHGLIVRTAAEGASREELAADVQRLLARWQAIEASAREARQPQLLYREPDMAVRIVREELNRDYRAVLIDDWGLYEAVRRYVEEMEPELADRVEYYDPEEERLPIFERFHVHEQLHKALDRKVWLPSGGSIIIERTEALTVIDVNTGKNVGRSNLEETVFRNNLEAAEEIARQLRLRDIGGIIVIDFIDMEHKEHREQVTQALRAALARDKTRTQVFEISELGLVEMTRKRVSEGLVEALSQTCQVCGGRGLVLDRSLL